MACVCACIYACACETEGAFCYLKYLRGLEIGFELRYAFIRQRDFALQSLRLLGGPLHHLARRALLLLEIDVFVFELFLM